ncbi:MAG: TetR/AcrR family transcriptional regulator [Saccharospirillaceae bacterium]|nr:TetR/AcrR family transcriptional regulator [Pseudomonadales bacterium]NRB81124.1 TetR/AcrR family transcriptional regulator [Saccharospirillaceae bacterium]
MSTDKKEQLIQAAIDLFSKHGFWNSSTASIAKHAKVATGTLFNYFPNKESLIDEVYLSIKADLLNELSTTFAQITDPDDVKTVLEQLWYRYIHWSLEYPVKHDLLNQLKLSDLVSKEAKNIAMASFAEFHQHMMIWLNSGKLKPIKIEYFAEIFASQMQACIDFGKDQQLKDMVLAKHIMLGFAVFWDGIKRKND